MNVPHLFQFNFWQFYVMLMKKYQVFMLDNVYLCGRKSNLTTVPLASDMNIFHEFHLPDLIGKLKIDPLHLLKHQHSNHE